MLVIHIILSFLIGWVGAGFAQTKGGDSVLGIILIALWVFYVTMGG